MKLKLNALKVNSLLSRDQMKNVMAGYGDGASGCGYCAVGAYFCVQSLNGCYCPAIQSGGCWS